MREPVPLHRVHDAILGFCRGRTDVVNAGTHAVNVYVAEPHMGQAVNILARAPGVVARELARHLAQALDIATHVGPIGEGIAYRVYQTKKGGARHLAHIGISPITLADTVERDQVHYLAPHLLTALKVISLSRRHQTPKGATDLADLRRLLLALPTLRGIGGGVDTALSTLNADDEAQKVWRVLLAQPLVGDDEIDEGY